MPTPSDSDTGIDAALSFGATSSNALDQRLEPRRLGVWLGFAFVLHVAGFAAFVVWQPTWFELQTAVPASPDAPVDVTWLGEGRAPEAALSAEAALSVPVPAPAPAPARARPSPPSPPPPETGQPLPAEPAIARAPTPPSTGARANEPTPVQEAVAVGPTLMTSPPSTPATSATPAPSATQAALSPLAARAEPVDAPATTGSALTSPPSPVVSKPVAQEPEAPVSVVRVEPSLIASSQQPPIYPRASRRAGEAGTVVLRINIAASGAVTTAAVVVSSGFERLDAAAQEAVQKWRFTPGTVSGVPTAMPLQVPIRFELQ